MTTSTATAPIISDMERFALDRPLQPATDHRPIEVPFGARFATDAAPAGAGQVQARLCPVRQIATTGDGQPWYRTLTGMVMSTTGPSSDGGPGTGGEEWSPDYQHDADAGLL